MLETLDRGTLRGLRYCIMRFAASSRHSEIVRLDVGRPSADGSGGWTKISTRA
ncbi:MAG: hypothetical protein KF735_12355 [Chelatococcus sp.]|uniref:hypothetical protein n=1 Tax=Chelatococcus sp. TaxID=1953771 RepID=UPI0025BF8703|nr:hypothetical protein [Chelatococcus sp.]MBX3538430.1 hypothetical protein [Chelatococcus sp.]